MARRKLRDVKQEAAEAGQQYDPTIRPELQVLHRRGHQFLNDFTENPIQVEEERKHLLHGQLIYIQDRYGGNLLHRHLFRHGGHLQDGKSSEHMKFFGCFKGFVYMQYRFSCKRMKV